MAYSGLQNKNVKEDTCTRAHTNAIVWAWKRMIDLKEIVQNWDLPWFFGWEIEGDTKKMKYKQVKSSVSRAADNRNRCLVAQNPITTTITLITMIAASKILLSHFTHPFLCSSYEHKTIKRENLFAWHRRFVFLPSFVFIWLLLSSFFVFSHSLPLSFSVCVCCRSFFFSFFSLLVSISGVLSVKIKCTPSTYSLTLNCVCLIFLFFEMG